MLNMNKKGLVPALLIPAAIAIVVLLIGLIAGFKVLFSTSYLFYAVGITMMILTIVSVIPAALKGSFTVQKRNFVIVMLLISLAIFVVPLSGFTQSTLGDVYIQAPTIGYYECAPSTAVVTSDAKTIPASTLAIACPASTDRCTIIISTAESQSSWSTKTIMYKVFDKNGNIVLDKSDVDMSMFSYKFGTIPSVSFPLTPAQYAVVGYYKRGFFSSGYVTGANYRAQYQPYILWDNPGLGGRFPFTTPEVGCIFKAGAYSELIMGDTLGIGIGTATSAASDKLPPYAVRNYLDVLVPINIESSRVQGNLYCQNNKLYPIGQVSTPVQTYKSVNYQAPLSQIKDVECCSGQDVGANYVCTNNKKVAIPSDITKLECSITKPCPGFEWSPSGDLAQRRFSCISNKCVADIRAVECNYNSDCGSTQICDTKNYVCINAPLPQGGGEVIPTPQIEITSHAECTQKANDNPFLGYSWVTTKTSSQPSWLMQIFTFGYAKGTTTESGECKAAYVPYYILALVALIFGSVIIYLMIGMKPKRKK